jgi:hypothetical protein
MSTPSSLEGRMARLEGAYEQINLRLGRIEDRLDLGFESINARMDQGFQELRTEIRRTSDRSDRLMYAILGFLAAAIVALVAALLR